MTAGFVALALAVAAGVKAVAGDEPRVASAAAGLPRGSEPVRLNPAHFTTKIDNPYWPMRPGAVWVYRSTDSTGAKTKIVLTVTRETRLVANGIRARVVRDVETENGKPVEITDDWYAQDREGNVWYLGEAVRDYENGKLVSRAGSFEAGVDGAQPGIIMPAHPVAGLAYRQEYYKGEAEDYASIVSVGKEQVKVPFGFFDDRVLMTRDLAGTEPTVQELKLYAPGVGMLLSLHTDAPFGNAALVSYRPGS